MPPFKVIGSSPLREKQFVEVDTTEIRLDSGLEPGRGIFWLFSVGFRKRRLNAERAAAW